MDFVDEEDDASVAARHLFDDCFEAFFKFAFVFGTGHQCSHVERIQLFVFQVFGHVAAHDTLGQTLDDGRLSRSRFTDQYRVVLGAAREDLQYTPYLVVPADDRVELALPGFGHQVLGIFFKGLIILVARSRLHLLSLAQVVDGLPHVFFVASGILQDAAHRGVDGEQRHHDGFDGNEIIAPFPGRLHGCLQHLVGFVVQVGLPALHLGPAGDFSVGDVFHLHGVHAQFPEDEAGHILALEQYALEQMHRFNALLTLC